nr:MAG TPA: hypothetical protein [Bacteriophage sp.]
MEDRRALHNGNMSQHQGWPPQCICIVSFYAMIVNCIA